MTFKTRKFIQLPLKKNMGPKNDHIVLCARFWKDFFIISVQQLSRVVLVLNNFVHDTD